MKQSSSHSSSSLYREVRVPADTLAPFLQAIHNEGRVGTLTVCFGTGGVPCGQMVWKERVLEPERRSGGGPSTRPVESTGSTVSTASPVNIMLVPADPLPKCACMGTANECDSGLHPNAPCPSFAPVKRLPYCYACDR